jgi:hypothetical protein
MIGSGYASIEAIRQELAEAGNARIGIGFILWALVRNPSALDMALDARPAAVMLSFGDPTSFTGRIKDVGCKIICQVRWFRRRRPLQPAPISSSRRAAMPAVIPARCAAPSASSLRWSMRLPRSRSSLPAALPTAAGLPPRWRSGLDRANTWIEQRLPGLLR